MSIGNNWGVDNATGRDWARAVVADIRKKDNPTILGHIVKDMVSKGSYGGVESGFFHFLSEELLRPSGVDKT